MTAREGFGGWEASAIVGDAPCGFVPIDWLKEDVDASSDPVASGVTLTVEVRYFPSGRMPWALIGGQFEPSSDGPVEFVVGHSGETKVGEARSCQGPLGRRLVPALPLEFARGAISGFGRCSAPLPPGCLSVTAGGYDEVESSFWIFESAACLLRSLFSTALRGDGVTDDVLYVGLQQCAAMARQ